MAENVRPASGGFEAHRPTLIYYWADTQVPLTHYERKELEQLGVVTSATTREMLILHHGKRMVVVRAVGDPHAPPVPAARP